MKKITGFTLIEVLVALVILAIALTAVIKTTADSINNYNSLEDRTISHWIALNMIASVQAGLIPIPTDAPQKGQTQMLNRTWYWTLGVESTTNSTTRIYVDVSTAADKKAITHLVGFAQVSQSNN